ncbi:hypothetical protein GOB57_08465 [Sinorhizobium meliloti]|nr:hypothetical protein [Sinorhizobium meliloti]
MAKEKKPKPAKRTKSVEPMSIQLGWLEADSAKDARAYARGIIQQRFKAHEESWYAVLPFHGGFLWEAHQGGDGKAYIKSAARALEDDPGGEHWFKTGDRAYRVIMQDGKPFPHLLPPDKSVEILNSGTESLVRSYSMTPYVRKGTGWLVTGITMSGSAALFFIGSIVFYAFAYNPGPSVRATDISSLPHTKWPLVANTGIEEIVQKLQMKNGRDWSVDRRTHKVEGLDKLRQQRADLERANRERDALKEAEANAAAVAADKADEADLRKTIDDAKAKGTVGPTPAAPDTIPVATPVQTVPAGTAPTTTGEQR